jgi:arylsulfatase A-like enzyme
MDRRRAVIDERGYKIIAFGDDRSFQLYDLTNDPEEKTDLTKTDPQEFEKLRQIYADESAKIPVVPVVGGAKLKGAPPGQRY